MSNPADTLSGYISNLSLDEHTTDDHYAKKIRNLVCSTLADDAIDEAAKCQLVDTLLEEAAQNESLCDNIELSLASLYAHLAAFAYYTNSITLKHLAEKLRQTLAKNVSPKLLVMAAEFAMNSWASELRNDIDDNNDNDHPDEDRPFLPRRLNETISAEEFTAVKIYFLLKILTDAFSNVRTNKISPLFASTASVLSSSINESSCPPYTHIIPLLNDIIQLIIVVFEKHSNTCDNIELLKKSSLYLAFTSIATLSARLPSYYTDLLDQFLQEYPKYQQSRTKLLGDSPESNLDFSTTKKNLQNVIGLCTCGQNFSPLSQDEKSLNIYFNILKQDLDPKGADTVLKCGHLIGFYILFSKYEIPETCQASIESVMVESIGTMIQHYNTSFSRKVVLYLIWSYFLQPKRSLDSKYFIRLIEVLAQLSGSSPDHITRFLAFQFIEIIIKEILSDNDILQFTLLKIIIELTPFDNVTSSSWSLLKDLIMSKLEVRSSSPYEKLDSSPFLSPFLLQTLDTLYTLGRPSFALIKTPDDLPDQIQSCHGKVTFLYYLISRDEKNLTSIRDEESINKVKTVFINTLRVYVNNILADGTISQNLRMELYTLDLAIDRLENSISFL